MLFRSSYACLKAALVRHHSLSDHQKIDRLLAIDSLGGRTPSELLADMIELCPAGEEETSFFLHIFLLKLPREVRILLANKPKGDLRLVAEEADRLLAHHKQQPHDTTASVAVAAADSDVPGDGVVAAAAAPKGKFKKKGKAAKKGGRQRSQSPLRNGLCRFHNSYGRNARRCLSPCDWPAEN